MIQAAPSDESHDATPDFVPDAWVARVDASTPTRRSAAGTSPPGLLAMFAAGLDVAIGAVVTMMWVVSTGATIAVWFLGGFWAAVAVGLSVSCAYHAAAVIDTATGLR